MAERPRDLREALGVTPFLHLVPKQDLAPLLASINIEPVPPPIESSTANASMEAAIDRDPTTYSEIIDLLAQEFESFDDPELDSLKFRMPTVAQNSDVQLSEINLPPLEQKLFDSMTDIADSSLTQFDISLDSLDIDDCLSVIDYENLDDAAIPAHKKLYSDKVKALLLKENQDTRKRDLDRSTPDPKRPKVTLDQKALEEQACNNLMYLSNDLGEDLDQKYLWTYGETVLVNHSTLIVLLDNLTAVYNKDKVTELDVEVLITIQKLSILSVTLANSVSWYQVVQAVDSNDSAEFQSLLGLLSHAVLSSKTLLLISNCSRTDRVLFVDTYFQAVVQFATAITQDCLIPVFVKEDTNSVYRRTFSSLLADLTVVLSLISEHVNKVTTSDSIITKVEYLCIQIVFTKTALYGPRAFENLNLVACRLLVVIFQKYPDQRHFLLNELLTNFDRLPHLKSVARQVNLPRGGTVQFITWTLVQLVQCVDELPEANTNTVEFSCKCINASLDYCNIVANFFIDKLNGNPDANYKSSFLMYLEDLSLMLTLPEWPGAELLLSSITKSFLAVVQSATYSNAMESFCIDQVGKIGGKILELKCKNIQVSVLNLDTTADEFNSLSHAFIDTLEYVQVQSPRSQTHTAAFKFLLLKYISMFKPLLLSSSKENHIAALQSENDSFMDGKESQEIVKRIVQELVGIFKDNKLKLTQALSSDKDVLSVNSYTMILLTQELLTLYDRFINTVVQLLDSSKVKSKTRAVKILASLIDQDTSLLLTPKIQDSVSKSLLDNSPLVRDAVIDLISKYMLSKTELIDQFHKALCDRLNDESILVRKRVLKLSKVMYMSSERRKVKSHICIQVIKRIEDEEDTVVDMAKQFFTEIWFDLPCTTSCIQVMMDVVSTSKISKYFRAIISEFLFEGKNKSIGVIRSIVDKVLDIILDGNDGENNGDIEKLLILVSNFVRCEPKIVTQDQLMILQPYLVDDKNPSVCFYCLQILKYVLPGFPVLRPDFIESTQRYLLAKLTKFDVKELHQAMPSAWILCEMNGRTVKLCNASISCMRLLKPFMDKAKGQDALKPEVKLIKLLHLLGCFGSYCNFETQRESFTKANVGLKGNETVTSLITKFLLFFCNQNYKPSIRGAAIKNIIHVCAHHPKLFMSDSILNVLDQEFAGTTLEIKHAIILGIISFLNKEDTDSQKRNGLSAKESTEIKLDVAVFHGDAQSYMNDGICAGLIQRYLNSTLALCLEENQEISLLASQFLEVVVKLGFANPKVCMPTVIALESSTNGQLRKIGSELHREIFEKHESLSDSSYVEGLKLTVRKFDQRRSRSQLTQIYSIVNRNYSSRKKFIQAVAKTFEVLIDTRADFESVLNQRDLILHVTTSLIRIQLASIEEILILVHSMDKTIARQAIDLSKSISKLQKISPDEETLKKSAVFCQTLLAVMECRSNLVMSFGISVTLIENFRPTKPDLETRQAPKTKSYVAFDHEGLGLDTDINDPAQYGFLFARLIQAVQQYT